MKEYTITMPFAGAMTLVVVAENEQDAKEKFFEESYKVKNFFDMQELGKWGFEVLEWDFFERMGSGNVRHYSYDRMEIEEGNTI